jgi:signal transduction histidine kinase
MSHELRNPMHAIISASDLLQHTQLSTIQQNYLKKLNASSQHILGLVDGVLDLSRLEAGRLELQQRAFKPQDELNTIHAMFASTAQQKGLSLTVEHDAPPTVIGDSMRISQVLINLVSNAIKFTAEGSVNVILRSQTSPYPANTQSDAQAKKYIDLYFEVLDSGIGIPPQTQQQMFTPFEQGNAAITRHYGGSGVGLAISHKLVDLMGTQLNVASQANKGSRFYFTLSLPIAHSDALSKPAASTAQRLFKQRILLVDDDEVNRFMG